MVNAAVTANSYTLYSDAPPGAVRGASPPGCAGTRSTATPRLIADGGRQPGPGERPAASRSRRGRPATAGACCASRQRLSPRTCRASRPAARLNFQISTTYPGKIEIGISTDTQDREPQEAYLQIQPGDYGYCNTGAWCKVSIPLSDFPAVNPKLDLSLVLSRFIIADRYAFTGKPEQPGITDPIVPRRASAGRAEQARDRRRFARSSRRATAWPDGA